MNKKLALFLMMIFSVTFNSFSMDRKAAAKRIGYANLEERMIPVVYPSGESRMLYFLCNDQTSFLHITARLREEYNATVWAIANDREMTVSLEAPVQNFFNFKPVISLDKKEK